MAWTKLFASIVTSSIWVQDDKVLRVWMAMLATCDSQGRVEGSLPGFASLCRVSIEDLERAIRVLAGPDPYSRTPDHEGRRIEVIPGGWRILNYLTYREMGQDKQGGRAPYMREYRKRYGGSWPTPKQRAAIMERYNHRCVACGAEKDLAIDHIIPRVRGGTDDEKNLQVLCRSCNLAKRGGAIRVMRITGVTERRTRNTEGEEESEEEGEAEEEGEEESPPVPAKPSEGGDFVPYLFGLYRRGTADVKPWDRNALTDALARGVKPIHLERAFSKYPGLAMKEAIERIEKSRGYRLWDPGRPHDPSQTRFEKEVVHGNGMA